MSTRDIILTIAVDLERVGRWASQNRPERVTQFLAEIERSQKLLASETLPSSFQKTYERFCQDFDELKTSLPWDDEWAEKAFTWANILTARVKLI